MSATPVATPEANTEAAEAAVEAITGAAGQDATFSLALSQDQKDIRDWVHGFAADVMRPAAHEWDEKEQTPWPIIQEAAKIGLYGFEGIAQFFADPTGLACQSSTRSCSGATPGSACRSWAPRSRSPRSSAGEQDDDVHCYNLLAQHILHNYFQALKLNIIHLNSTSRTIVLCGRKRFPDRAYSSSI